MKSSAARVTWILAVIAVILLVAVAVVVILIVNDRHSFNDETAEPTTSLVTATATETPPSTHSAMTQSATTLVPPAPEVTTDEPVPEPTGSTPISGGPCLAWEVRSFATSPDGQDLVCNYLGADGGYVWVGHAENDGTVHSIGDPCDSSVDRVAHDPSGKAIMCGGDTWVGGP